MVFYAQQIDEEASEKVVEVDRKYDEIRKPVYDRRNEIIKTIPDFWLTAVSTIYIQHVLEITMDESDVYLCLRTMKFLAFVLVTKLNDDYDLCYV